MNELTHTFRGQSYRVLRGATHPEYSLHCFTDEEADFREKYWHPLPGQVVVDVGASYGAYALTAAACGALVHAFEPEPSVFVDLQRNAIVNQFQMHLHQVGLWNEAVVVDMESYAPHWPKGTITAPFTMLPLDRFNLPRVDWLKIDCEGAEDRVLEGAQETIARCRPRVIVECHVFLDAQLVDKCRRLLPGYMLEAVPRDPCVMLVGSHYDLGRAAADAVHNLTEEP